MNQLSEIDGVDSSLGFILEHHVDALGNDRSVDF